MPERFKSVLTKRHEHRILQIMTATALDAPK